MAGELDPNALPPLGFGDKGGSDANTWFGDFVQSGIESIPELIGIRPSQNTQRFRAENPTAGFVSEFVGTAVPYVGWFKATRAVKGFDSAISKIGNLDKSPFLTGAAQEAARFLPFEAGRVGVSQAVGEEPLSKMLGEAALNLAIGSGAAGILHGIAAAGTREPKLQSVFPGLEVDLPLPLQLRQMKAMVTEGAVKDELADRAAGKILDTARAIRAEELPSSENYIGKISIDVPTGRADDRALESQLNRLFRTGPGKSDATVQSKRFADSSRDFKSTDAWRSEARAAGLADDFEELGQYFRTVSFKTTQDEAKTASKLGDLFNAYNAGMINEADWLKKTAKLKDFSAADKMADVIDKRLTRSMDAIGDNWFMAREAEDGLFVLARKYEGLPGKGTKADKWLLLKTDNPGNFVDGADKFAKSVVAKQAWVPTAKPAADGGHVYNTLNGWIKNFSFNDYMALSKTGSVSDAISKLLPKNLRGPQNEALGRLKEGLKDLIAPRQYQFQKSARANWIITSTKVAHDAADMLAQGLLYGRSKLPEGKSLLHQSLRHGDELFDGLRPIKTVLDGLTDAQIEKELNVLIRDRVDPSLYEKLQKEGRISPEVRKAAEELDAITSKHWTDINKVEAASGRPETKSRKGHLGLSRSWEGDYRVILRNEGGTPVAMAAGPTRKAALKAKDEMLKANPSWVVGEEFSLSQQAGIPKDIRSVVNSPSWTHEATGLRGFKGDLETLSRADLLEMYERGVHARARYQAELATEDLLLQHRAKLQVEDPHAYKMVEARINDYRGVKSAFNQVQNQFVDQFLAPVIGINGADKIVRWTNSSLYLLHLGAMKLSYPITNMTTFLQTVMPEVAWIRSAPEAKLAGDYAYFAAGGEKGPAGAMGAFSPIKFMARSMGEMRNPTPELREHMNRAINDAVVAPRFVEEYFGESATKVTELRKAMSGGKEFLSWLHALSDFLPANTERMSRVHSFTVGHMLGRDYLRLEGEGLYRFAKQFTEKTMYLYSAADRPRIFTTPAGSSLGLFKNWMFNYMHSMAQYAGEGFTNNNWAPFLWQTAGTAAIGGVAATPLYWIADGFSKGFTNKSLLQNSYEQFGEGADGIMYGLPAVLTGMSFYSNTASPAANPVRDASQLFSIVAWDRMKYLGKAAGSAMDHWMATGEHPGRDRDVQAQLVRALAPTTLYRAMGAWDDSSLKSLSTGYPMMKEATTYQKALYTLGINPVELDKQMAVADMLYKNKEQMKRAVGAMGDAWHDAQARGDGATMAYIMQRAVTSGVDVSSVMRSAMARSAKERQDIVERGFKLQDIQKYRSILQP